MPMSLLIMLCSHLKKFIYLKTRKTASTTIEIFFEPYCLADQFKKNHSAFETISSAGIVGSRKEGKAPTDIYFNHMPGYRVKDLLGDEIFNSYLKFCSIRNPYDATVSRFWWLVKNDPVLEKFLQTSTFPIVKKYFNQFVLKSSKGRLSNDKDIFMINGKPVIDFFIRYENLSEDLKSLCSKLNIPFETTDIGEFNVRPKFRNEHYSDYFNNESKDKMLEEFKWIFDNFDYSL